LARLQQRLGATMIYVTHDQTEAMTLGHRVAILNGGRIQQVGSPRQLYRNPSNLFVAGFLGSPGMNIMAARIDGAGLVLPIGTIAWKSLPPGFAGRKQPVLVGIRPEHFHRARTDESPPHALMVEARAEWVEWLGAETFVQLGPQAFNPAAGTGGVGELASAAPIVARLDGGEQVAVGSPVRLWVDAGDVYVFDANSGVSLSPSPSHGT
jgi:multiple sugar transport system ATP-binding protein